jgi:hypothetical protein
MDFIKKHYEKVLLGVVLIGLAAAVAFLPFVISGEKQKLTELANSILNPKIKPLTNLDLTMPDNALKLMSTPATIDFSAPNRLFNPMAWQKAPDGRIIPVDKAGPTRLSVTNITPLWLKLSFESVSVIDPTTTKYQIGVLREVTGKPKRASFCKVGEDTSDKTCTLIDVKGKPEDPTALIVKLKDTGEEGTITKDKPFMRADGYTADLYYDLEKKPWLNRRVGNALAFNGEDYKIVAINQNEVILQAPNGKKWPIKYSPESHALNNPPP